MGKNERQAYLKAIRTRYRRAGKKAKVTILDEFCAVCGYHRKYAIRLLNQRGKPKTRRQAGRKPVHGEFAI
jgi:ribosomal protein L37E